MTEFIVEKLREEESSCQQQGWEKGGGKKGTGQGDR